MERSYPRAMIRSALALVGLLVGLVLSLPVILLALPFWITAAGTRFLGSRIESRPLGWPEIIRFDPWIGWKPKPNLDVQCSADEVFRVTTGSDGWRGKVSLAECEMVVLGDSFAFGYGVGEEEMFARLIPSVRVKPIGAPGYNLVQEFLLLRESSSQLAGKLIVWFIFLGNDLWDNLHPYMQSYTTPFLRRFNTEGEWQIESSHLSPRWRPYKSLAWHNQHIREMLADCCSSTYLAERAYSACEYLIREAAALCSKQGAQLCVFTIPDRAQIAQEGVEDLRRHSSSPATFDPALPDRKLEEICTHLGVMFVAGRNHFRQGDYRQVDRHWNKNGHRRAAEILLNVYSESLKLKPLAAAAIAEP